MSKRPAKIDAHVLQSFLREHPGWEVRAEVLRRSFRFATSADGVAFAVALAIVAESRDHHPELRVGYARVEVLWSTHDVGGLSSLDVELAEQTERVAARHGAEAEPG